MKKILSATLILATLGLLVSCGPGKAKSELSDGKAEIKYKYPVEYKSDKPVVEGATYTIGVVTTTPFKGIFSPLHIDNAQDRSLFSLTNESIFWHNEDFELDGVEGGMATLNIEPEKKQVRIKFKEGLKWSDGEPLTVDDYIYTFEVLAHPDYEGITFNESEHYKIEGVEEYHKGKAKSISGLEKISDTELVIHFKEMSPKLITGGGALLGTSSILPKHYLSDVPVKDLPQSDKIRKNPISNGRYVVSKVVLGESFEFVPNEYYYLGKSNFEKVIVKPVTPQLSVESLKNGEFFTYSGLPQSLFKQYKDFNNIEIIGNIALSYSYMAFNLGHYDKEKKLNVTDRDTPLQDVRVRKALSYAINTEEIISAFFDGLKIRANGQTPSVFRKYYDDTLEGYPYNPEKSKALLEEAGYTRAEGEKYYSKDGKILELNMAFANSGEIAEPLSKALIQNFEEVGIKVGLTTGRLLDGNLFFDKIQSNSDDVDIYIAGWSVGTSLDPAQITSRTAAYNFNRFASDENDRLLKAMDDPKGLTDPEYRSKAYKEWQKYYIDQAVEVPLWFSYDVSPVNKAIKYENYYYDSARTSYQPEVTSMVPAKVQ